LPPFAASAAAFRSGCLSRMLESGVECLDVYCVDNILARVGDPLFIGYCHDKGAEVGARVVSKAFPEEKVTDETDEVGS